MTLKQLDKNKRSKRFFSYSAIRVARQILGDFLIVRNKGSFMVGKIVEVEAYLGINDDASHSFRGKITPRNRVLFERGGVVYVYSIYGKYICFNIVVSKRNDPQAVFIRALEPILGMDIMLRNRKVDNFKLLTNGPCRWTSAFGIDKRFLGKDIVSSDLYISKNPSKKFNIISSKRIGIDYATKCKDLKLRFYIEDNPFVSKK